MRSFFHKRRAVGLFGITRVLRLYIDFFCGAMISVHIIVACVDDAPYACIGLLQFIDHTGSSLIKYKPSIARTRRIIRRKRLDLSVLFRFGHPSLRIAEKKSL